jgi:hypothetical protein
MGNRLLFLCFLVISSVSAQDRLLIFANGYLGPSKDQIPRDNGVSTKRQSYWYQYDDTIINRFMPTKPIYISGHHPLSTSPHRSKFRFACSYAFTRLIWVRSSRGFGLNTKPNPEGFLTRYENGKICGRNFLQFAQDSLKSNPRKDTLDFVCHSMGYAYVLGFLTQVDTIYNLGKILIIAPETPGFMGYDWNKFQEVWQYGSNLGEKKADLICMQDGIAPQGPVKNLETLTSGKGGRVFVPKHASRGFVYSHHLNWFDWFYTVHPGDYGFFTR